MKLIRELRAEIDKLKSMMGQVIQRFCEIMECNSAKLVNNTLLKVGKEKKRKTLIFVKKCQKGNLEQVFSNQLFGLKNVFFQVLCFSNGDLPKQRHMDCLLNVLFHF